MRLVQVATWMIRVNRSWVKVPDDNLSVSRLSVVDDGVTIISQRPHHHTSAVAWRRMYTLTVPASLYASVGAGYVTHPGRGKKMALGPRALYQWPSQDRHRANASSAVFWGRFIQATHVEILSLVMVVVVVVMMVIVVMTVTVYTPQGRFLTHLMGPCLTRPARLLHQVFIT